MSTSSPMYYSINDIERDGTRIPTQFQFDLPELSFLKKVPGPVEAGEKFKLPLWLAVPLASTTVDPESDQSFATIEEPEIFNSTIINAIKTDPINMDLKSECPVYTSMGIFWANIWDSDLLKVVFYEMIRARAAEIYDRALAQIGADPKYDEWERHLYRIAHLSRKQTKQWLTTSH